MDTKEVYTILEEIGLSPAEISVYCALLGGIESVQEIIKKTGEKRPTVYYSLNSLEKRGLVSKTGKDYGNKFQVEPIEKLLELVDKNIRKQNSLLERTKKLKDIYPTAKEGGSFIVSHYDTFESISSAVFYTLYTKSKTIKTIVPGNNFFNQVGKGFIKEYVGEKVKRKIKTKALWEDIPSTAIIKEYYAHSEIKQIPLEMHNRFETTIFIYDDCTLYIAPKKDNSAVLISSKEHARMMNAMFDSLWKSSFPLQKPA